MCTTRRGFLMGCSAAIANLAAARFTNIAFASPLAAGSYDTLVVLFLRGGIDGLSLVMPTSGPDRALYEAARPTIKIPNSGASTALDLGPWGGNQFGLHPAAGALYDLWQDRRVAFVHAAGLDTASRSHFDNQAQIELGTPGVNNTPDGWITRHLVTAPNLPPDLVMPSVAVGSTVPTSYQDSFNTVVMANRDDFLLNTGPSEWRDEQKIALRNLLDNGATYVHATGTSALDATTLVEQMVPSASSYVPANGATYPSGSYGDALKLIAQLVKLDLGLRAVTLDLGGWDTHNGQGTPAAGQYFWNQVGQLAGGLGAFYTDLAGSGSLNYMRRVTVVVMSEFGRRLHENADIGTDHGHGNVITVVGGPVVGGLYGSWPGLANAQLYDQADLAITTDFRRVLAEIVTKRLENPNWASVFPGYGGYQPLGVVTDLFADGFETGDTRFWG
jgi:uncharacterized protein (DUF1501 family)